MKVMLSCGEPSGDLYAGALTEALRRREPAIDVFGLGGERFKQAGGRAVASFEGLSVTGLTEAIRVLPRSFAILRRLIHSARTSRPDVFVAIDFPDFNFRLMSALRRLGVPVVYYISPQLWAWRPGRMRMMQQLVDEVLVIFPFEEPLYADAGVPVRFVGHPLIELSCTREGREAFRERHRLADLPTVALLPGSRPNELRRIVPVLVHAVPLIRARVPRVRFVIAAAPALPDSLFTPLLQVNGADTPPVLVRDRTDDVLSASDVVITASGTATVQAALHQRPMVVVYRLSPLTYRLGKRFVKVDTYAMANLVAGERVVPELIQDEFTPERVAEETVSFLTDRERYDRTVSALGRVREKLGEPGASARAAEAILEVARRHQSPA